MTFLDAALRFIQRYIDVGKILNNLISVIENDHIQVICVSTKLSDDGSYDSQHTLLSLVSLNDDQHSFSLSKREVCCLVSYRQKICSSYASNSH